MRTCSDAISTKIEELYTVLRSQLEGYAHKILLDWDTASDVTQDAFQQVWRVRYKIRNEEALPKYIFTVLRNLCINEIRKRQCHAIYDLQYDPSALWENPEDVLHQREQKDAVMDAMDKLPPKLRIVIELFYFEEQSYNDIAQALNINLGTVKSRLHDARQKLRELLNNANDGEL